MLMYKRSVWKRKWFLKSKYSCHQHKHSFNNKHGFSKNSLRALPIFKPPTSTSFYSLRNEIFLFLIKFELKMCVMFWNDFCEIFKIRVFNKNLPDLWWGNLESLIYRSAKLYRNEFGEKFTKIRQLYSPELLLQKHTIKLWKFILITNYSDLHILHAISWNIFFCVKCKCSLSKIDLSTYTSSIIILKIRWWR